MSPIVQRIRNFDGGDYTPAIYNFSTFYEQIHGVSPETLKPIRRIKVVISQAENNTKVSEAIPVKDNVRSNIGFVLGALTSTLLVVGAYTTNILDRFSGSVKKFIELALDVTAISLVTITANGFLNGIAGNNTAEITNNVQKPD